MTWDVFKYRTARGTSFKIRGDEVVFDTRERFQDFLNEIFHEFRQKIAVLEINQNIDKP